ncbi:MAG: S-adenosylmethionine decarboxylase [Pedobacter sp.]|nr:MAG: S-adenosylmethionine decarboxylase [Pedobacter sp.]
MYNSGTHLIATLTTSQVHLLNTGEAFNKITNELIEAHGLNKLGEVYHDFSPAGFTAVICLSESHISIHTWPEHELLNMDIYLSNYERTNDDTVKKIYEAYLDFFQATVKNIQTIKR